MSLGVAPVRPAALGFFERWLPLWVGLCMAGGLTVGKLLPGLTGALTEAADWGR